MKILNLLIALCISGGALATETPGTQSDTENNLHKKLRISAPAEAVIDITTPRKKRSNTIEANTLAHRALPGSGN